MIDAILKELDRQRVHHQDCGGGEFIIDGVVNLNELVKALHTVESKIVLRADQFILGNQPEPYRVDETGRIVKNDDDWILWDGSGCPVDPDTRVDIKFDNGDVVRSNLARYFTWEDRPYLHKIVAYRVS